MKVSLVVASGVHQGKSVPIVGPQFLIGRDQQCHLRPASQAVSKQHCAVIIRDGKVFLKDYGSTNGTVLNDAIVKDEERQLKNNDSLKIGPLDFTVRIDIRADDGTPLPEKNPAVDVAIAAVKAASAAGNKGGRSADHTPAPGTTKKPSTGSKEAPALPGGPQEVPALTAQQVESAEQDRVAAMLLGLDDDVPGGSTVVDAPSIGLGESLESGQGEGEAKAAEKKSEATPETSSSAASDLLRKYMRRPR